MNKLSIENTLLEFNNEIKKTGSIEKAFVNYLNEQFKEFDGLIDYENYKKQIFGQFKTSQTLHLIFSKKEIHNTLANTLSQYDYEFLDEQIEVFNYLVQYDKACIIDDQKKYYRLNTLLCKVFEHLEALEKWHELEKSEDILKKGIARTPHPIVSDAIKPRIKTINDSLELNPIQSNEIMLNIYNEFESNPLEITAMYNSLQHLKKENFLIDEKQNLETLFNQQTFLNSAKILEDTHIFNSCKITSYLLYKEKTIIDLSLQLNKHIPYTQLSKYMNTLIDSFFDYEYKSNLSKKHIEKEVQLKTHFNNLEILEFRTKMNYQEHPIFNDIKFG